jgi:hypothetical protein
MPVDLDAEKDGEAEAHPIPSQRSSIPIDVSFTFEPFYAPQARRW